MKITIFKKFPWSRSLRFVVACLFIIVVAPGYAQGVKVNINSGNPKFPFPQFLPYEADGGHSLGNLGTRNAPGVTHAEMEKLIREAWQIMANGFVYTGEAHQGVKYMKTNIGCPYDCTEGVGYSMIAAAYMGDKEVFDGIWFREHDVRMPHPRFRDGVNPYPNYKYGKNTITEVGGDAATDGDVDFALGLLMAWRQWGDNSGYTWPDGTVISYKEEALKVIRGLVERENQKLDPNRFDCRSVSGNVGFDGYFKNGNTWGELTAWASSDPEWCPEFKGPQDLHIDYVAPAYFNHFARFLEQEGGSDEDLEWNISQLLRAEASSDWLVGQHYQQSPTAILSAGWVSLDANNKATFTRFNEGEDFRFAWRTAMNYMWNGNPTTTWNPVSHQVEPGGNTFEKDMAIRHAEFLSNPGKAPWGNGCVKLGGGPKLTYMGPSQLMWTYTPDGEDPSGGQGFPLNWNAGTGSPAAVSAQDYELMGKLYHMCAIEWDIDTPGDGYLTSVPKYFHGFFRLLGLMILSGNHHGPYSLDLESNMKVYLDNDKTYAFTGDLITYTVSYRNYASIDATGVKITTDLPEGVEYVSSTGGAYTGGKIEWGVGTVPGFQTATGVDPTKGEFTFTVRVKPGFSGQICPVATITTTNGTGWTSNEYPNNVTPVMERNCVDIVEKALEITKKVNYDKVNPGTELIYDVEFENASSGGYINGGRPDVVPAYAHKGTAAEAAEHWIMFRLYHGAAEPYIDYQNYRLSLFLNDNVNTCSMDSDPTCTAGWRLGNATIYEGGDKTAVRIFQEDITPGSDARGAWNQRLVVQFSEQYATSMPHLSRYFGIKGQRVHQGGSEPLRAVWQMSSSTWSDVKWDDDWSWNPALQDVEDGLYYPVANDWTDINNPDRPVTVWHNEACEKPAIFATNILVEEWDGYTWRRIYGSGPLPGRDVNNVVVTDIIPEGFTFVAFVDENGVEIGNTMTVLGEEVTYNAATRTITWTKDRLQIKQKGNIRYKVVADFSSGACNRADEVQQNVASIAGDNESPVLASVDVTITCEDIILPPPPSSMTKTSDKNDYDVGESIVYTLEYENVKGSLVNADLSGSANWKAQSGALMGIGGGQLSTISNDAGVTTYNYSHGVNGIIEAAINFQGSASFGFAFRHTGGAKSNGLYIIFKPNPGNGTTEIRLFNGTTQMGSAINTGFPNVSPSTIKLELVDDQVNIWMGNTSNPTPTMTFTGFPVRAGYAGFVNGWADNGGESYGTHRVVSYKTQLDSGFDIEISDPVPDDVTFVSASDNGAVTGGVLKYPIVKGPVLKGEIITYTWTGTIASCPANGKIVNNAYTNVHGFIVNSIASQNVVSCLGDVVVCTLPDTVMVTGLTVIEEGESTTLTAETTPDQTGFVYQWFKLPDLATPLTGSGPDATTLVVGDTGRYVVRIVQPDNQACTMESAIVRVVLDETCTPPDDVTIQGEFLIEAGASTTLTATWTPEQTGWNYSWYKLPDLTNELSGSGLDKTTLTVSDTGRYAVKVANPSDPACQLLSDEVEIGYLCEKPEIKAFLDGIELDEPYTIRLCEGQTAELAFAPQKYDFEYDIRQLLGAALMDGVPVAAGDSAKLTVSSGDAGSWLFNVYADPGNQGRQLCWSISDLRNINIVKIASPDATISAPEGLEYCSDAGGVALEAVAGAGLTYVWKKDGVEQVAHAGVSGISGATEGVWRVIVSASANCVDSSEVTVVELASPVAVIDPAHSQSTYCAGGDGALLTAMEAGAGASYVFLNNGVADGAFSTQNTKTVESGQWTVVVESASGCRDTSAVFSVEESSEISLVVSGDTVLCEGDALLLATNMGSAAGIRWTLPDMTVQNGGVLSLADPEPGLYKVEYSDGSGCSGSAEAEVRIEAAGADPVVSITGNSFAACVGDELAISALAENVVSPAYEWYVNNATRLETSSVFSSSSLEHGDWVKVIVRAGASCKGERKAEDSVMVTINELPEARLEADKTILCQGESLDIRLLTSSTLVATEWRRNGTTIQGAGETLMISEGGDYSILITDNRGCVNETLPIQIEEIELPGLELIASSDRICEGVHVTMEAVARPAGEYQYVWFKGSELEPGANGQTFDATVSGAYSVELEHRGCLIRSESWTLSELTLSAPVIVGEDAPVCEAQAVLYSVQTPSATSRYEWTTPSGATIVSNGGATVSVSFGTSGGTITVVETNSMGCASPAGSMPIVLRYCDLKAGFEANKTIVCAGDTVEFVNTSAGVSQATTYNWNFGAGAVPARFEGPGPVKVVFNQAGFVRASLTIEENNVARMEEQSVEVKAKPVIQSITGADQLCADVAENYAPVVAGGAIRSLTWTLSANLQAISSDNSMATIRGIGLGAGSVSVSMVDFYGCGSAIYTKNVSVVEQPDIQITTVRDVICQDETTDIVATGSLSYTWYFNEEAIPGFGGSRYETALAGEYYATTGSGACYAESNRIVIQVSRFDIDAGFDRMINMGESVQLETMTSGQVAAYLWKPDHVAPTASPVVTPVESTVYTVQATDIYGCTAEDDVYVQVALPLFIPNAFTPNGDGVHDTWEVRGLERFTNLKVEIFNRWGNLIYSTRGAYKPWDGKKNGVDMPVGTYYYVIDAGDEMKPITGSILLSK